MSPSEHANCPWCRTNEWLEIDVVFLSDKRFVWCTKCDSSGPRRDTADEAWAAWDAWCKGDILSICSVDGCNKPRRRNGLCGTHSTRMRVTGTTEARKKPTTAERFMRFVSKGAGDECWEWTGHRDSQGYGRFHNGRRMEKASRVSYRLFVGQIKSSRELVCHKCDNPSCVRPDHLFLGSHAENMKDMASKGRSARLQGGDNPSAKITKDVVIVILKMLQEGKKYREIADATGVSMSTVGNIKRGDSWSKVTLSGEQDQVQPMQGPIKPKE